MIKKIYVAGPMRGRPLFNFRAFDETVANLRAEGYEVISPADMDRAKGFDPSTLPADWDWHQVPEGFSLDDAVLRCVEAVIACDGVFCLDGWEQSKGASAEVAVAQWLGKQVLNTKCVLNK